MRSLLGALFSLVLLGAAPSPQPIPFQVEVSAKGHRPGLPPAAKAKVTLKPASGRGEPLSAEIAVPGTASFAVEPGSTWEVAVESAGSWSRPKVAAAGQAAVEVELVPAGEVSGQLKVPAGAPAPGEILLRLQPSRSVSQTLPQAEQSCPVRDRLFRCPVPAGTLDLRVRARGFLSHYRWDVQVPAERSVSLGALQLQAGSSVVGWIAAPSKGFRFEDCKVELAPRTEGIPPTIDDFARRGSLAQTERVDLHGFFQFAGVAPGSYELVALHPLFAPAHVAPVEVLPGAETDVQQIELLPPASVEVALEPALDSYGTPWSVELLHKGRNPGNASSAARSAASPEGIFRASGLEPGRYVLKVYGSFESSWLDEELELAPGPQEHPVRLPFLQVRGEVTLAGEPLFALLWFGGHNGPVKIAAKSDAEGKFEITLPEKEKWRVEVSNPPEGIFGVVPEIAVRRSPGKSYARVTIDLPDTGIAGQVVDEDGKPATKAKVRASGPGNFLAVDVSEPEARFTLRGLATGSWYLDATAGRFDTGESAETAVVELVPGRQSADVRLVLRKQRKLTGIVVAPNGYGIPGARVSGLIEQEARLLGNLSPEAFTDSNGQFVFGLPAAAEGLQLTVQAPGFAVTQVRIDPRRGEPLVLPVQPIGGTLVLDYGGLSGSPARLLYRTSLFHEYLLPAVSTLEDWAEINGKRSADPLRPTFPLLEQGRYTACLDVHPLVYRTGRLLPGLEGRCVSGELSPFGELVLKIPGDEEPPSAGE